MKIMYVKCIIGVWMFCFLPLTKQNYRKPPKHHQNITKITKNRTNQQPKGHFTPPKMSDLPLHIAIRPLTLEDLDKVAELEALGFPPNERCSREGLIYRLTTCPELSSGLFIREFEFDSNDELPQGKSTIKSEELIGHVLGTKIFGDFITEASMEIPTPGGNNTKKGHIEGSNTIGIHSVVVHPDYQKKNLATLLLHDYIQKLSNQQIGDKISIIAKDNLLPFYNRLGFITKGESECQHGGEKWFDLSCPLIPEDDLE